MVVLARLTLSDLPATENEFVSLTFTPRGQDWFGFGPTYTGVFDEMTPEGGRFFEMATSDFETSTTGFHFGQYGIDTLGGTDDNATGFAVMRDIDPPNTMNRGNPETVSFSIRISDTKVREDWVTLDRMEVRYIDENGDSRLFGAAGWWQAVPEPASIHGLWPAIIIMALVRRKRSPTRIPNAD